nr:uncharacterized protein LOC101250208 [Solanum lycopersicum]
MTNAKRLVLVLFEEVDADNDEGVLWVVTNLAMNTRRNNARKFGEENLNEADLAAYQLEDLDRVWYDQLKNERPIIKGQITWGALKTAFLGRFFLLELRERKIQEFINLDQGDMSIKDYSLKFTQLSKYAPTIVADSSAKMNKFVNGISDLVVNECRSSMLIPRMDISRLMVHVEQIEDQKLKQVGRELKKGKVPTPKPQEGKGGRSYVEKFLCAKCDSINDGKLLVGTGNCYGCGKSSYMKRYFPMIKSQVRKNSQDQASAPNLDALKKNRFYALQSQSDQESSVDVVTVMLKLFSFEVYALLDPGPTSSFVTLLVAMKFDILPDILDEPFLISTPVGASMVVDRVYKGCPISLPNRVAFVDLIELHMLNIDVIFGMNRLHACFASIDCRTRVVKIPFPNEPVFQWKGGNSNPKGNIISCLKSCKVIAKGSIYHIVRGRDFESEVPPIESVPVVREFPEIFPDDLPGISLEREIDFNIDLLSNTQPISIPPYRMSLA